MDAPAPTQRKPIAKAKSTPSKRDGADAVIPPPAATGDVDRKAHGHWGGYESDFGPAWFQAFMILSSPVVVLYLFLSVNDYQGGFVPLEALLKWEHAIPGA